MGGGTFVVQRPTLPLVRLVMLEILPVRLRIAPWKDVGRKEREERVAGLVPSPLQIFLFQFQVWDVKDK